MSEFSKAVYTVVSQIPKSHTMTYKEVAKAAGRPKAYRAVGNILNKNRDFENVPCHRVIRTDGSVGGYSKGRKNKRKILRKEGFKL